MANGVIPPPGGASPLPQVTDAQELGRDPKEERDGIWLTLGPPDPGMELGWGYGEREGILLFFQVCCPLTSQALGPGEKGLKKMEVAGLPPPPRAWSWGGCARVHGQGSLGEAV